jgi:hypothetical protein
MDKVQKPSDSESQILYSDVHLVLYICITFSPTNVFMEVNQIIITITIQEHSPSSCLLLKEQRFGDYPEL